MTRLKMGLLVLPLILRTVLPTDALAITFHYVEHTPFGGTTASVVDTLLAVSGMGASGLDGLNVFPPAPCVGYSALFDSIRINSSGVWTLTAMSGSQERTSMTARKVANDSTRLEAGFIGLSDTSTVRVSAYLGGVLVRSRLIHPEPQAMPALSAKRPHTDIFPLILLGAIVIGICSDSREDHIHLPSDPPGVYSASTTYTFLGYGIAHSGSGHIGGDNQNITFDKLVIAPVTKTVGDPAISRIVYSGVDVQPFKIGPESFILSPSVPVPGWSSWSFLIGALSLSLVGGCVLAQRRRRVRDVTPPAPN